MGHHPEVLFAPQSPLPSWGMPTLATWKYLQPAVALQCSVPVVVTEMWRELFHKAGLSVNLQTSWIL